VKTIEACRVDDLPIYPIRRAAHVTGVEVRRIRAWENKELIRPAGTRGGNRLFSRRDLELILRIKRLIDDEGLQVQSIRLLLQVEPVGRE